ncbi:MAG: ATP-dependent helicase C-terminal domain-containing protein [Pirellulales bacterium]
MRDDELFVCVDLREIGETEALVKQASAVRPEWLDPTLLNETFDLEYDDDKERVYARRRKRYLDLTLQEGLVPIPETHREAAIALLADRATVDWKRMMPYDSSAKPYVARWEWLRTRLSAGDLEPIDDEFWRSLIRERCVDCVSLDDLRKRPWLDLLKQRLDYEQRRLLDREAPEDLLVPSGSRIKLEYDRGDKPVLQVRIQELFGMTETPRIVRGRVPVLLYLLGPNYLSQQVTEDLASFWKNTYPEVKKDLKRRYPKHAWPDDPLAAVPVKKGPSSKRG